MKNSAIQNWRQCNSNYSKKKVIVKNGIKQPRTIQSDGTFGWCQSRHLAMLAHGTYFATLVTRDENKEFHNKSELNRRRWRWCRRACNIWPADEVSFYISRMRCQKKMKKKNWLGNNGKHLPLASPKMKVHHHHQHHRKTQHIKTFSMSWNSFYYVNVRSEWLMVNACHVTRSDDSWAPHILSFLVVRPRFLADAKRERVCVCVWVSSFLRLWHCVCFFSVSSWYCKKEIIVEWL